MEFEDGSVSDDRDDRRDTTEVRFHASLDDVAVVDALAIASGSDRTSVMRRLLKEFCEREVHRATLVLRLSKRNAVSSDTGRKTGGK